MDNLLAAIFAVLLVGFEHYFPWRLIFRKPLPRLLSYIIGVLAIYIPVSVVLYYRNAIPSILTIWIVALFAGAGLCAFYLLDPWLHVHAAEKSEEALHDQDER
jgi:hypothetical protein